MATAGAIQMMNNSTSYTNIIGNLFGIVVAAELDSLATWFYHTHLECNHNEIVKSESYL